MMSSRVAKRSKESLLAMFHVDWRGKLNPFLFFLLCVALWEAYVLIFNMKEVILPSPFAVGKVLVGSRLLLLRHILPTLYLVVVGFVIAVIGGILTGILIVYSPFINRTVFPLIVVSQVVPKIAVAPLLMIWFGMTDYSRLLLCFLISYFPLVINTATGLQNVDENMIRMGKVFTATKWQNFKMIMIPHALPYIFSGMKITITVSVIGVIVAEFVASQKGIGYVIIFASGHLDTALVMAALVVISVVGWILFALIEALEKIFIYWSPQE